MVYIVIFLVIEYWSSVLHHKAVQHWLHIQLLFIAMVVVCQTNLFILT